MRYQGVCEGVYAGDKPVSPTPKAEESEEVIGPSVTALKGSDGVPWICGRDMTLSACWLPRNGHQISIPRDVRESAICDLAFALRCEELRGQVPVLCSAYFRR